MKTVVLTEENKIEYTDNQASITDAFQGMAPGDTKTVTIRVENENSHAASFFISQETLSYLEEKETASGGAYMYDLKVGESEEAAVSLLDTVAGGYDASLEADKEGLSGISELENYQYLAELGTGEYTNVYLTLTIDGEGFDSTDVVNYENTTGQLEFNFRAYYEEREPVVITEEKVEKEPDNIIVETIEKIVEIKDVVQTGDSARGALLFSGIFALGIILFVAARKVGKAEK